MNNGAFLRELWLILRILSVFADLQECVFCTNFAVENREDAHARQTKRVSLHSLNRIITADMKTLFDNTILGHRTLKNRMWRSATWMALADSEGNVTDELVSAYEELAAGGLRSIEKINQFLNDTKIEYVSLSRPLIREPNLINRWQKGDIAPSKCVSCNSCYRTPSHQCIFNLRAQSTTT